MFNAVVVRKSVSNVSYKVETVDESYLSKGDVLVKVVYSSINYKDMLALQYNGGVIRDYPMIPGIDFAGIVESSSNDKFKEGDNVLVTGYDVGVTHTGGFSEYAQVPGEWIVPIPQEMSIKESMVYGTAGFTAALSIFELEKYGMNIKSQPEILVSGATGGVGSVAIQILRKIGYENITAIVRKEKQIEIAKKLGAKQVIIIEDDNKPLKKGIFDYFLDTVGSNVTLYGLKRLNYQGVATVCGNVAGNSLNANILPFILRGIKLIGIDSVYVNHNIREDIWSKLANEWNIGNSLLYNEIGFEEFYKTIDQLLKGKHLGRTILKV
ncbi:TPA: oxidoreductase [Staphylococcus aureus]|uniref:oxidoreductase n=1 Tax=Staphylococcus aureus TaxID=1280 RepID=UPI000B7EFBF8|nr:oxidoreductase [Staphylococcus aureus]MBY0864871.1 oxidoreductase [Staphylococcus aureus]OXL88821.1 NADPH:quinone reductase [Staphylococcus aureus]HCU9055786.1 oxidoreductase [Staphylococcus aureus]HCU9056035.1 oxidoreductase [Staphylococcus aureus]HDF6356298.1 oxidoreductase [Staphylococcus aureus]